MESLRAFTICSAFTLDCRYYSCDIDVIVNVWCPNTMCSEKNCGDKVIFQSLGSSDYQGPQYSSTHHVRNIPFKEQTSLFFLKFGQGVVNFEETQKFMWTHFRCVLFNMPKRKICSPSNQQKFCCYGCKNAKFPLMCQIFVFGTKSWQLWYLVVMVQVASQTKTRRDYEKRSQSHFLKRFIH